MAAAFNAGGEIRFARRMIEGRVQIAEKHLADTGVKLKDLVADKAPRSLAA
jgi:hypothetical protein